MPDTLAGFEFQPGRQLESGYGHGTQTVNAAVEERGVPAHRAEDDNRRRHVGLYALYDWCWGSDEQYLHATTDDWRIYSHDHGWYLPESGPDWTESTLASRVADPHPLLLAPSGLDQAAVEDVAQNLESLGREALREVLRGVPVAWGVPDSDLEALGWFLETRAQPVAARLRAL